MKKKIIKIVWITLVVIALIIFALYINLFVFGNVRGVDATFVTEIAVSDAKIELLVETTNSSAGYKGYKYEKIGNTVEIRILEVLVSDKYPNGGGSINIKGEFSDIDTILIIDNDNKKEIWTK